MRFIAKTFDELTTNELYEILKARGEIFVVEQNINYQDMDGVDYKALHCFIENDGKVSAYLRAFLKDENERIVKIGRVLTIEHGKGVGRKLLEESLPEIIRFFEGAKIVIDAQKHAVPFYEKFGFSVTSGNFLEEGIVHQAMEYRLPQ